MALDEATRAIEGQHGSLEALRSRAVTLVSAGALVFSLFTAQALGKHHVNAWIWMALAAFGVLAIGALLVLWPRKFRFRNQVTDLLIEIDGLEGNLAEETQLRSVQRDWAYWANSNYDENQTKIDCLTKVYTVGLAAVSLELLFLSLSLVTG